MSKSFADIVAEVYSLTNRPDLVNETALAVRAATLKAHHSDFYYKDVFETGISFSSAEYIQSLPYKDLIPLWRSPKYIRKVDASTTPPTPLGFLQLVAAEDALDSYRVSKENVYYIAGTNIQLRSRAQQQYYVVGCYVHPDVTQANYNSWIADEHPYAIIYEATAIIFKTIGYDEQVKAYRDMVMEEIGLLKMSNLEAVAQ
jgi:hypothetical protein